MVDSFATYQWPTQFPPITREPKFSGREGVIEYRFASVEQAARAWDSFKKGGEDRFLADAWKRMEFGRTRDARGRFQPGWRMRIYFNRPARNEAGTYTRGDDPAWQPYGDPGRTDGGGAASALAFFVAGFDDDGQGEA